MTPGAPGAPRSLVLLTTGLAMGGAEMQLVNLARRLRRRGWEVRVVSMTPPRAFVTELEAAGVEVADLGMRPGVPDVRGLWRLRRLLRMWRPAVLHAHMVHANLLARLVRPLAPGPVVVSTAHSIDEGGRWREWAYRLTDPLADITTNVSEAAVQHYVRIGAAPRGKIRRMANGVDIQRFRPDAEARAELRRQLGVGERFTWLAVGRFEPPKDYPTMLRALARVPPPAAADVLLIAGDGGLRAEVEGLIHQLGLSTRVRPLGMRADIPALMQAADAYLMSSAWEGLPMVLLEAAASALPIVATDVGGNPEAVVEGETGFLVPPRDAGALAEAADRLVGLPPAERLRMGGRGRAHAEARYSLERVVDQWEQLYAELLGRRGSRYG